MIEEADHQRLAQQRRNESESLGHRALPGTGLRVPGVSGAMWPMARRNCGESWQRAADNMRAMPIAIFDLDGTITHRDTLFPLVLRQLARRPWHLLRLAGRGAGRDPLSHSITTAPRSSNPCCAPRCAARRAASSHAASTRVRARHHRAPLLPRCAGRHPPPSRGRATTWCSCRRASISMCRSSAASWASTRSSPPASPGMAIGSTAP